MQQQLKLIAFDAEDLSIVSAHLQDAVVRVGDMTFLPREQRFAAVLNRFDWTAAHADGQNGQLRRQSALRFERVLRVRSSGVDLARKDEVLALLAIVYEPSAEDAPSGTVTLTFAGNTAIRLDVECIEAELRDLGPVWQARGRPTHPIDEGSPQGGA